MNNTFSVISPIDNSVYIKRDYADEKSIQTALNKATSAQALWKQTPLAERQALCTKAIDIFVSKKDDIAEEITWQMGRPIRSAAGEVGGTEERARKMIELSSQALQPIKIEKKEGFERWIQREAIGVVLIIAPWNFPYMTAINAIMPAILSGNAVLLKHSAQTPLCSERLVEAFTEAGLPDGVFQFLHLNHTDTEALIKNNLINYVAFTGSVAGGKMVKKAASGRFIGVGLELGGKDPAYIRSDANLAQAVDTAMDGAFFNSGQSCCGIERLYVHESVYDDFLAQSIDWVKQLKLGRSDDAETTLGPLVKASAADYVRQQTADAVKQGAVTHIDPNDYTLDETGSPYLAPQILTNVDHSMSVMTDESFGPIVGIQKVSSDEEAIKLMNDSEFGLTAAIFTTDIDKGIELGQQLETGTFFLNRCDYLDPDLAWTGVKNSGQGCTLSVIGYESLTRPKSFHIKTDV